MSGSNPILEHFDKAFPLEIRKQGESPEFFSISASLAGSLQGLEVCYQATDGSELTLLVSSGQIQAGNGIAGCVLTLTDVTSRKRVEQALVQSEKLAAVGRMASSIAHESITL